VTGEKDRSMSQWHKSSACTHTTCVEVQFERTMVRIRNSRHPDRTVEFTADEWDAFLFGARAGEFERRRSSTAI
jgi:hypothetical protein